MNDIKIIFLSLAFILSACSSMYYGGLEKIGIPKREVMVYRVEKARDTQEETKEQFKSALEQFTALTGFQGGDLEATYNKLNSEYEPVPARRRRSDSASGISRTSRMPCSANGRMKSPSTAAPRSSAAAKPSLRKPKFSTGN